MQDTSEIRQRILDNARILFLTKGYKGTGLREIAMSSDIGVGMVNYYFKSKYDLFEIIYDEALDLLLQRIYSVLSSDLTLPELIEEWVESYSEIFGKYPQIPLFILNELSLDPTKLTQRVMKSNPERIFKLIEERISKEVSSELIEQISMPNVLLNILSMCVFPYMFRNLAPILSGISEEKYNMMLKMNSKYVTTFILNSLQCNNKGCLLCELSGIKKLEF